MLMPAESTIVFRTVVSVVMVCTVVAGAAVMRDVAIGIEFPAESVDVRTSVVLCKTVDTKVERGALVSVKVVLTMARLDPAVSTMVERAVVVMMSWVDLVIVIAVGLTEVDV